MVGENDAPVLNVDLRVLVVVAAGPSRDWHGLRRQVFTTPLADITDAITAGQIGSNPAGNRVPLSI